MIEKMIAGEEYSLCGFLSLRRGKFGMSIMLCTFLTSFDARAFKGISTLVYGSL